MGVLRDLSGQTFGRLTVIDQAPRPAHLKSRDVHWRCRCTCGGEAVVRGYALRSGNTKSCGCLAAETPRRSAKRRPRHGLSRTRTHYAWCAMRRRVRASQQTEPQIWRYYGAKAVGICPEWEGDYAAFLRDMGECPEGMTLDRIDPAGPYETGNCRWATSVQQARNRSSNRLVTVNGQKLPLIEAAELAGLNYNTVLDRVQRGWPDERLLEPIQRGGRH